MKNKNNEFTLKQIEYAHTLTFENKMILNYSEKYGCMYCLEIFKKENLEEDFIWVDRGNTAICPYCSVDVVIPEDEKYPLTKQFLEACHNYWFEAVEENLSRHVVALSKTRGIIYWEDYADID